uniref:Uncharacterized protein n=1 Tax=Rhizophora mucronata TaxID=61149 RepID=A0A2P2N0Q8_RHIMU
MVKNIQQTDCMTWRRKRLQKWQRRSVYLHGVHCFNWKN